MKTHKQKPEPITFDLEPFDTADFEQWNGEGFEQWNGEDLQTIKHMVNPKTKLTPPEIEQLAYIYIDECLNNKKENPTASGKVVLIKDRHIPTIDYFLKIWIPKQGRPTICRKTFYNWLNGTNEDKLLTIKRIEGVFIALAIDIVANEGKGIFYAKNKLGFTDKAQIEQTEIRPIMINLGAGIDPKNDHDNNN